MENINIPNNTENENPTNLRWVSYKLKDGSIVKKQYDNRPYMMKYREKHHDELYKSIECEICHGSYNLPNKAKHLKTTRHVKCEKALNINN